MKLRFQDKPGMIEFLRFSGLDDLKSGLAKEKKWFGRVLIFIFQKLLQHVYARVFQSEFLELKYYLIFFCPSFKPFIKTDCLPRKMSGWQIFDP
ncbi:MAG TPA: hypothetical protein PK509_15710 [Catalimonadaceae bacterium]|nr:hypothetical protein [Catalimonadaceae bacterium]HPI11406.1 hypothetical protein [Catalimonadaceae bacterium]